MPGPMRLDQENLALLSERIPGPGYDRSRVKAGIVHVGVGGFHRSHQAFYTDALMNKRDAGDWGICGVGLREGDRRIGDILKRQDYLYTLIVSHPDGTVEPRIIGSLIDFMLGNDDPQAVIDRLASPHTKIVSLTITEGGYNFNPATGDFDFGSPDMQHDLAHPHQPSSVFGYLTAALKKRRAAGRPAFTIQSCDNIQHNGDMARKMLLAFVERQDPNLPGWIEAKSCFPNAMVDRITPVTTDRRYRLPRLRSGSLRTSGPVTCEPFSQWVIEDRFSRRPTGPGRPVGAQFVPAVDPYEKMKIRLLNAGHSVLGLLGAIHGHPTIDSCVADPLFARYLRRFMDQEATPVLDAVPGIDLDAYKDSLVERFGNPNIKDSVARICLESSSKLPSFLIPTITENLDRNGMIDYGTLVIAAWCYYSDHGTDRHGQPLDVVDELKSELHQAACGTERDRLAFLKLTPVFGDLAKNETFAALYGERVEAIYANPDVSRLMQALVSGRE